jgi:virginiamycin B lyase
MYGNRIGRITTAGVITEFALPTAVSNPWGIAAGPDGALWFTQGADVIGRITTAGVITEFALPTADSSPTGIAVGPDGALWFTQTYGQRIGRITTGAPAPVPDPLPTRSDWAVILFGLILAGAAALFN